MNDLKTRIENKRKELAEVIAVEDAAYRKLDAEQDRVNRELRNPWNELYTKRQALEKQLAALETIAKEMEQPA